MKKILVLIMLVLFAGMSYAADADTVYSVDMQTWVTDLLNGTSATWTTAVIRSQLNLNAREFATVIGIPKEDTLITSNSVTDYALNTDFWTIRGVVKLSEGRKKMMRQKGIDEKMPYGKGLGEETVDSNIPQYFAIKPIKGASILVIDPFESASTACTLIVSYNAYATELTGDSTITNVPYGGVPLVVYGAALNCMIRNRQDAFVQIMLPIVERKYTTLYGVLLAQGKSSFNYDPEAKPATQ